MRSLSGFLVLVAAVGLAGCFFSSVSNLTTSPPAEDPASGRLNAVNKELTAVEQEIAQLESDRAQAEGVRNEAFMELGKLTGMGPKAPSMMDYGSETLTCDPGMMISMHNANMTAAGEEMKRIDARLNALHGKAANLRAERKKLEQAAAASRKSSFSGEPACFLADTPVRTPDGMRSIAAIAPGATLLAYDEKTGVITPQPVRQTFRGREDHYFLINGEIRVTAMHRFLTREGWVRAKDLEIGAELKTAEGWTPLVSKKLIDAEVAVFNMEVAEHHDFFVHGAGQSYLVHNTGGGGGK